MRSIGAFLVLVLDAVSCATNGSSPEPSGQAVGEIMSEPTSASTDSRGFSWTPRRPSAATAGWPSRSMHGRPTATISVVQRSFGWWPRC